MLQNISQICKHLLSVNDEKFNEVSRAKLISGKLNIPLIVAKEQNTNYDEYKKLSST